MTQFLQRTALILVATSALGACSTYGPGDSMRPNFPVRVLDVPPAPAPAATPPPPPVAREEALPQARPTPGVESRPLEPLPTARPPALRETVPAAPVVARPATPPPPTFQTVSKKTVTGKVVEVEGPAVSYEIKKGDNLEKIAKKLDTTVEQLRDDNKIKKSGVIQPGAELKGPKTTAKAYVVGQGDTVYAIAKRFGVTAQALADENDVAKSAAIRAGRKLRLPAGFKDKGPVTVTTKVAVPAPRMAPEPVVYERAAATQDEPPAQPPPVQATPQPRSTPPAPARPQPVTPTPAYTPPAASPPSPAPVRQAPAPTPMPTQAQPYSRPATPPAGTPTVGPVAGPTSAPPASDAQISQLGRGRFIWPVKGEVLSDYGPKTAGQRNDGLNIRTGAGDAVRAAAAGDVVYAGDQVPGFGNLVLVKHADGWVTAYGHLSRVDVKMQQKITQGQQIGLAGSTGGVAEPQLHFEVRYAPSPLERARPIDPRLVLPR